MHSTAIGKRCEIFLTENVCIIRYENIKGTQYCVAVVGFCLLVGFKLVFILPLVILEGIDIHM